MFLVAIQFACIFFLALTGSIFPSSKISLTLEIFFLLFGLWAIMEMKFRFSIFPELLKGASLVTSGPYRFVRHPMYTAILFVTLLWLINYFSVLRFFIWVVLVVTINIKFGIEEKILNEKFTDYHFYQKKSKKIIPFIY